MAGRTKGLLETHLAALLFGGTALFSKWITLPAVHITLWRSVAALVALILIQIALNKPIRLERRIDYWAQFGLGAMLGIHWATYFGSMQVSTIAIGLVSLFTAPVLTVFLEPLFGETRLRSFDVLLGLCVLAGVYLMVPEFSWENRYAQGVAWGLVSAVFLSLRNILHRRAQRNYGGPQLMIYQIAGLITLFAVLVAVDPLPVTRTNAGLLVVLGLIFTAIPHTLIVIALRHLSARTVLLVTSLMLVYGTALGWLLLGEVPRASTLVGGAIIATCAVIEGRRS